MAGFGHQGMHQGQFAWRQVQHLVVVVNGAGRFVKKQLPPQRGIFRSIVPCAGSPAVQGPHPGLQFVQVKGFGQIVVGAGVQPNDAVAYGATGGKDEYGRIQSPASGLGQNLQAVQTRQAQIQQDNIRLNLPPARQCLPAVTA